MAPSRWKLQVAVAEFRSKKPCGRKCQKHLPAEQLSGTGTGASSPGGQQEPDTAFCHLPAPCGTGIAVRPWQHRGCSGCRDSRSLPGALRAVGSPARTGHGGSPCWAHGVLGTGEQPPLASPLLQWAGRHQQTPPRRARAGFAAALVPSQ